MLITIDKVMSTNCTIDLSFILMHLTLMQEQKDEVLKFCFIFQKKVFLHVTKNIQT